jgi:2-hydroxychromene-2-carboxylate isomerase
MSETIRFYFSFRSPYSWLATYRISKLEAELPVTFELVPVFPPKNFKSDPAAVPDKVSYIKMDVERITKAYGFKIVWPHPWDTDWIRPHASFLYAEDQGKGMAFSLAVHTARFCEGLDVGDDEVIKKLAAKIDLDPEETLKVADDRKFHKQILQGMKRAGADKIFGVPTFIYDNQIYWGNDRLEWLIRDINRNNGKDIPDLNNDPFTRPF